MRTLRLIVGLSLMGSMIAAASAGCSSDDPVASAGTPDAAVSQSDSGDPGPGPGVDGSTKVDSAIPTTIAVAGGDLSVYLGQIAQLDASGTTASPATSLVYKWTVDAAPAGSAVVTASLFSASSAKPSFSPDLAGDYKLKVVVSGGDATADKIVTVKAFEAQTVYMFTDGDGGTIGNMGFRATATVSDAGSRDLACYTRDSGAYDNEMYQQAQFGSDYWEGAPGTDSVAAYVQKVGPNYQLFAVPTSATCATQPAALDDTAASGSNIIMDPRISPSGKRIAYIKKGNTPNVGDHVMAVGVDASSKRTIGALATYPDGGPFPDAGVALLNGQVMSPRWVNDTTIGWIQFPAAGSWNIVTAADVDNAPSSLYMSCTAANTADKPTQFAFTPDGSVLVSARVRYDDAGTKLGARDLLLYKPNATTKACELVRNLTVQESDGGVGFSSVNNFSLSPDGTQVAYVGFDHTADAGGGPAANAIWTVAVNGLTPPAQVPGAPSRGALPTAGPRWLAGGSLLAWPQEQRTVDAGAGTAQAIVVSPAGGGSARVAAKSLGANKNVYAIGNGSACTIAAAGGSGLGALSALGALGALIARRRRR